VGPRKLIAPSTASRVLRDWGATAGLLRRSLKLYTRGDPERARRLLTDGLVRISVAAPPRPRLGEVLDRLEAEPRPVLPLAEPADIIVPVHNGVAHLRRLFATLFERTDPRHRFLLADDGSTDPEVAPLLAAAAAGRPNVRVLANPVNRGFVATVNAAMQATGGHAVVLNTDTEVPDGWVERLLGPLTATPRTASTTPFSNAAVIFSFPTPDRDNRLPPGLTVAEIDRAFARLSAEPGPESEAPTAIGFCMGVNRAAWRAIGPFDERAFGRGYGEETDWCLRAAAAGWRSALVPNLFVYHAHGGTFPDRERKALLERNLATLHRRWPAYYRRLATFRRRDPWATWRVAALLALATTAASPGAGGGLARVGRKGSSPPVPVEVGRADWRLGMTAADEGDLARLARYLERNGCHAR
jgi:O-antigen biosynthesis protein